MVTSKDDIRQDNQTKTFRLGLELFHQLFIDKSTTHYKDDIYLGFGHSILVLLNAFSYFFYSTGLSTQLDLIQVIQFPSEILTNQEPVQLFLFPLD